MVKQLTDEQKNKIKDLLHQGVESKTVAEYLGVSSRQVAAIAAHITMGSYDKEQTKIGSDLTEEEPRFDFPIYIQYFEASQFCELEISCS